jgi:hypothetical protein
VSELWTKEAFFLFSFILATCVQYNRMGKSNQDKKFQKK